MADKHTYRPIPLALIALVALFSALAALAVSGGHDAQAHGHDHAKAGVSVEEIIRYVESLTGLSMKIDVAPEATWGMKVLDATLRKQLAGPCKVTWKEGVKRALAARNPRIRADGR